MRSKMDQNAEQDGSKCGARWIKLWIKVDKHAEQGGAKDMCFYLIPNWSLALRQAHLNTGIMEISQKDYTNKMKSWMDRTINQLLATRM